MTIYHFYFTAKFFFVLQSERRPALGGVFSQSQAHAGAKRPALLSSLHDFPFFQLFVRVAFQKQIILL